MVFSSPLFLFVFLPITLAGYYLVRKRLGNLFLLIVSLLFYAWGEPKFILVMIGTVFLDYLLGLWGYRCRSQSRSTRPVIVITTIINVGLLFCFKYLNFTMDNLRFLFGDVIPVTHVALPIGISFFTFQAMSYVFDVCAGNGDVQKNPLNVLLYVGFFPQLIAGPIVRYQTVAMEINHRVENLDDFTYGIERFIVGLAKKAIFSNTLGITVDYCFSQVGMPGFSTAMAWLGAIGYSMQLYYDFSGYSDMAIGLGRMFGFHFDENFDHPYISGSVTEFWRRWHISMGTWFRDYVYFPLGGSRVKTWQRGIFNLFIVWLLTGIWHGANWTFIVWGMWHFIWIAFEKISRFPRRANAVGKGFYHIVTLIVVILGWVMFRAENLGSAIQYIRAMFGIGCPLNSVASVFLWKDIAIFMVCAVIGSFPICQWIGETHAAAVQKYKWAIYMCELAVLIMCMAFSVTATYDPFIYFNF